MTRGAHGGLDWQRWAEAGPHPGPPPVAREEEKARDGRLQQRDSTNQHETLVPLGSLHLTMAAAMNPANNRTAVTGRITNARPGLA